jgi:hypothetical protein
MTNGKEMVRVYCILGGDGEDGGGRENARATRLVREMGGFFRFS